jgi:hypothetical protein
MADFASVLFTMQWLRPNASLAYGAGSVFAPPLIHLLYARPSAAAISFGLRGVAYGGAYAVMQHEAQRCADSRMFFCLPTWSILTLTAAVVSTSFIDALLLSRHEVQHDEWKKLPIAPAIAIMPGHATFSLSGAF